MESSVREHQLMTSDIRVGRGSKIAPKRDVKEQYKLGRQVKNDQKTWEVINGRFFTLMLIKFLVQTLKCTNNITLFVVLPMKILIKPPQKQDSFRYKIEDIFITAPMARKTKSCKKLSQCIYVFTWNIELWFHYKIYIHEINNCVHIRKQNW